MKDVSEYRIGSIGRSVLHGVLSAIGLLIIPLLIIRIIDDPSYLDQLLGSFLDVSGAVDLLEEADLSVIRGILERAVWTSPAMIALSFAMHYYDEGNRCRMKVRIVRAVIGIARYLYIVNLGDLAGIFGLQDSGSDAFIAVDLAITGYLIIRIVIDLIDIPMAWAEFKDHREQFIEEHTDYYGNIVKRSRKEIRKIRKEKKAGRERSRTPGTRRCMRCT